MKAASSIALLDTDFISKTLCINDKGTSLLDVILSLDRYEFCCHETILNELGKHSQDFVSWMNTQISTGRIRLYSDKEIINLIKDSRHEVFAFFSFLDYYRQACDAIGSAIYERNFADLIPSEMTLEQFLNEIHCRESSLERGSSVGEIKTYILANAHKEYEHEKELYVFCSDDKSARTGAITLTPGIRCISLLSSFLWLKQETAWTEEDARQYINSYVEFCRQNGQQTFHVYTSDKSNSIMRVPCSQVLHEIFEDRYILLRNGFLRYKS